MAKASATLIHLGSEGEVKILGRVHFEQSSYEAPTTIRGELRNLIPGEHALSIHVSGGDLLSSVTGGHFNPFGKNHGAPGDEERHVGSLGNIDANANGVASISISDKLVKLIGPQSVIGRSIVVSVNADDLGKGGAEKSLINGACGPVFAMGTIGIAL